MASGIIVLNFDQVLRETDRTMDEATEAAKYALQMVAVALERDAKIMSVSGGITHPRGTPSTASPGGPPSRITGWLQKNIRATPVVQGFNGYEATVESTAVYARALELGNPRWSSGVNYPYMEPTANAFRPKANDIFLRAFNERWAR